MLLSSLSIVGRLFQLSLVAHLQLTAVNCNLGGVGVHHVAPVHPEPVH